MSPFALRLSCRALRTERRGTSRGVLTEQGSRDTTRSPVPSALAVSVYRLHADKDGTAGLTRYVERYHQLSTQRRPPLTFDERHRNPLRVA